MKRIFMLLALLALFVMSFPTMAQDGPEVNVSDQVSLDGTVKISSIYSEGPGFIVIHQDDGSGSFGAVIGSREVNAGWSFNVAVPIDTSMATSTLYAMLHVDDNEMGVYEFGAVDGADGPVVVDGAPVSPPFNVDLMLAWDQFVDDTVTIANVTVQVDGFVVIHADNDGSFGAVIGSAPVTAGQNSDVVVEIDADGATDVLWPMLHVDTGEAGVYEFGTVEGADGPVAVNGTVAVAPIWTVPHMRVHDQIVSYGDGMDMMEDMAPTLTAYSVLAEVDGFIVVHSEADGGPGPVAGFAPVSAGINTNVEVELDPEVVTPRLWPMLHVDTGEAGEYEFGTVEGADGPVRVNDSVVTFGIDAAPALQLSDQSVIEAMMGFGPHIYVDAALIDAQGWIALHSSVDGAPGPVIGTAPLVKGLNTQVLIEVSEEDAGTQVFPMLHYDTAEVGTYEFGTVDGADGPVAVAGSVVVAPIAIVEGDGMMEGMDDMGDEEMMDEDMDDMEEGDDMMDDMSGCMVSPLDQAGVNLRASASTDSEIAGSLTASDSASVVGQARGSDGFIWWNLARGSWVRSDIVSETGPCDSVETVEMEGMEGMDDMGSMEESPAATEEAGG